MPGAGPQDAYALATWLFLRALGLVYLAAFASFAVQARGLIGERGIVPARRLLAEAGHGLGGGRPGRPGWRAFLALPTLCWWRADDRSLLALCAAGIALALLVTAGVAQLPALVALYLLYLSLVSASGVFLGYQWDVLLLETGFLAIFAAPLELGLDWPPGPGAHPVARWLLYLLLFRLIISSGVVKLRSGDPTWRRLTALDHHYETQPLPHRGSWWAHRLPRPLQKASTALMLACELALPLLIFAPAPWRTGAAAGVALLMLLVLATGNYGFFNLLTLALCIPLVDDRAWLALAGSIPGLRPPAVEAGASGWPLWALAPVAAVLLVLALERLRSLAGFGRFRAPGLRAVSRALEPFRIVNGYGLFAVMTTSRPELRVEGSDDGETWRPYRFRWKPGDPERSPRWAMPHQPRLDWQMWFEALRAGRPSGWFTLFLERLLEGRPEVLALLAGNPFPEAPPRYVRAEVDDYRFTDRRTRRATGRWWRTRRLGSHQPAVTLGPAAPPATGGAGAEPRS
jgi:hypothetical protein